MEATRSRCGYADTGMAYVLLALGLFGILTSTVFAGMVLAGARHHLRGGGAGSFPAGFTPPLSLLKPVHGDEPDLDANLATFFAQDYPEFEILFCARQPDDLGLETARRVARRYPNVSARFFATEGEPPYINAKVASLEKMTAEAKHRILVISDSDVRVTPGYLRAVAEPFSDSNVGAMTCLYRGVAAEGGLWAQLEAVGMSVEMTAGVLVANMLEGMQFVLGPTMAVRRECVAAMGGMGVMGDFCSDDYILGNEVYRQGRRVVLSRHVIDHIVINAGFWDSLKHQARWMKSTRFSRPKGHFGTALTFSLPFGLLALAAAWVIGRPWLGVALLAWSVATRWAIAWAAGRKVVGDPSWFGLYVLYPIRDLMGLGFWAASYLSSEIVWRGRVYRLLAGGRMRAVDLEKMGRN
jgi:ceramide glucosyltransferase